MKAQCIKNQVNLDSAEGAWLWDLHKSFDAIPTWEDLRPYLPHQILPKCPGGGTYIIGAGYDAVRCSIPEHNGPFFKPTKISVRSEGNVPIVQAYIWLESSMGRVSARTDSNGIAAIGCWPPSAGVTNVFVAKQGFSSSSNLLLTWQPENPVYLHTNRSAASSPTLEEISRPQKFRWNFITEAYKKEALQVLMEEANQVAKGLDLKESIPITVDKLTSIYICPPGMGMFGNISTATYFYSAGMIKRFSTLELLNQLESYNEAKLKYRWPIDLLDTNKAIQTAITILLKINMDAIQISKDCMVTADTLGGQTSYFTPIYRVNWTRGGKHIASVEFLEPSHSIRHIDVHDVKYIKRKPLTTSNLRALMIEAGAPPSVLEKMESLGSLPAKDDH